MDLMNSVVFAGLAAAVLARSRHRALLGARRALGSSAAAQSGGAGSGAKATGAYHFTLADVKLVDPPLVMTGPVATGFGRGGKQLGCPTANIDPKVLGDKLEKAATGIYFGWARLGEKKESNGTVYPMVTSIGWNPTYKNEKKTVEPHIMHKFDKDFYGDRISIVIAGYIRPELAFESIDALKDWIESDKRISQQALDSGEYDKYKNLLE